MAHPGQRRRSVALALLLATLPACGALPRHEERLDANRVRTAIEDTTAIDLRFEESPDGVPGISGLAGSYAGATPTERIVLLDFFSADATREALGREPVLPGATVLRRNNLVLFYEREPAAPDHGRDVRAALQAATERD
jgi:hypothetical protein